MPAERPFRLKLISTALFFKLNKSIKLFARKTIVKEEGLLKQENEDSLVSFERFDAKKSLSIYNYLKYKLPTIKDDETRKWYVKSIRFFVIQNSDKGEY